jgi:hypothetical protein
MRPLGALVAGVIVLPSFLSVVGASAQEPTSTPGKEPTPAAAKPDDSSSTEELAKKAQNPIADLISVPFQNNINFNYGPRHLTQDVLNIQPVLPFTLTQDWNLITRWILPIIHQPSLAKGDSSDTGLGDLNPTLFLSTSVASDLLVGFGPTFLFPTASSSQLGTEKWGMGPSAVAVWMPGHWVVGSLINNIWSYAGPTSREAVNEMTLQYFLNYNLPDGWYLSSAPIITANWEAERDADIWTVSVGGGVGKLLRIGRLPVNTQVQAFWNAEAPRHGGDWTLRTQLQFLFPK